MTPTTIADLGMAIDRYQRSVSYAETHPDDPNGDADVEYREDEVWRAAHALATAVPQTRITALSQWVDDYPANKARDPEALRWHRVAKVTEEGGEAVSALIGAETGNPRKGQTHNYADVEVELYDVALSALGAVEHLNGNDGTSLAGLFKHIALRSFRAGIA